MLETQGEKYKRKKENSTETAKTVVKLVETMG